MFFALSGFIVAEAAMTFYRDRPGNFIVNRVLRIYPSYVAALVVTANLAERGWMALSAGFALSLLAAVAATLTYEKAIGRMRDKVRGFRLVTSPTIDPARRPV